MRRRLQRLPPPDQPDSEPSDSSDDDDIVPELVDSDAESEDAGDDAPDGGDDGGDEWVFGTGKPDPAELPRVPHGAPFDRERKAMYQNIPGVPHRFSPLDLFLLFWQPALVLERIVTETNRYAEEKQRTASAGAREWSPLSMNELGKWLGILLSDHVTRGHACPGRLFFWPATRCCSCCQPAERDALAPLPADYTLLALPGLCPAPPQHADTRLATVRGSSCGCMEDILNKAYKRYFIPGSAAAIDERSIACRHKLCPIRCFNPSKPAPFHLKQYCLNDWPSGYLYHANTYDKLPQVNHTFHVVSELASTLPHGVHMAMDRFYTGREVIETCHRMGHRVVGTVLPNRRGIPVAQVKARMPRRPAQGDYAWAVNKDGLTLCAWQDRKLVWVLGKGIPLEEAMVSRHGGRDQRVMVTAPSLIPAYWSCYMAVDKFDQLASNYDLQKALVSRVWWHRAATGHLANSVVNAYILQTLTRANRPDCLSHLGFLSLLAQQLVNNQWHGARLDIDRILGDHQPGLDGRFSGTHLRPERIPWTESAQCVVCATIPERKRTIASGARTATRHCVRARAGTCSTQGQWLASTTTTAASVPCSPCQPAARLAARGLRPMAARPARWQLAPS
eukprot:jgi/Mesvir1/20839/Mv26439-RA.1